MVVLFFYAKCLLAAHLMQLGELLESHLDSESITHWRGFVAVGENSCMHFNCM